jgi:hypothetical protein
MIQRRWDLLPYALDLLQSKLKQPENEARESIKILIADERVQARGPWPRGRPLNGKPRPDGRAHLLPAESFNYAEFTPNGEGVVFRDQNVPIPWVEINMDQLRLALAEEAQATSANSESAPPESDQSEAPKVGKKRGPLPLKRTQVKEAMRKVGLQKVRQWPEEALVAQFGTSRTTCRDAKKELESEIVGDLNSDK